MNIKGVFFDLVGTLLIYGDMTSELSEWYSEFFNQLQKRGLSISRDDFIECCDDLMTFRKEVGGWESSLTIFESRIKNVCSSLKIIVETEEIKDIATVLVDIWSKYLTPDPNCIPMLEALKQNKTLALISNFDHSPYVNDTVNKNGLARYFKTIVVSGDVGIRKPDPEIYHLTLRRTRLQPEEVVYIGDTDEDIRGSLSAGITPILIQRKREDTNVLERQSLNKNPVVPPLPDIDSLNDVKTISSLLELIEILK